MGFGFSSLFGGGTQKTVSDPLAGNPKQRGRFDDLMEAGLTLSKTPFRGVDFARTTSGAGGAFGTLFDNPELMKIQRLNDERAVADAATSYAQPVAAAPQANYGEMDAARRFLDSPQGQSLKWGFGDSWLGNPQAVSLAAKLSNAGSALNPGNPAANADYASLLGLLRGGR